MKIKKFQQGGPAPAEPAAPGQGGENPIEGIVMGMQQAMQAGDCNALMQVCGQFLEMVGQPSAPAGPAPTFQRKGGRLVRIS